MTKYLILNTKCQPRFLLWFHLENRRGKAALFSNQNETTTKISAGQLVLSIKSLVIGLSNEKKIYVAKIRFFFSCDKIYKQNPTQIIYLRRGID